MFLPIQHDDKNPGRFEEKQKFMWEQLHSRMDQRQKEWRLEMEDLRKNFFRGTSISPSNTLQRSTSLNFQSLSPTEFLTSPTPTPPTPLYHEFDVKLFGPDEISVRTHGNKLILQASHKELNMNKSVSRVFKREIDIPPSVDPQSLQCSLTTDGRLVITTQQNSYPQQSITFDEQSSFQRPYLSPLSVLERSEFAESRDECESVGSSSGSCAPRFKETPEWSTPLPDVVDNHFTCSETDTTSSDDIKASPPKCGNIRGKEFNLDVNMKSIYSHERPFSVSINLGKNIDPSQLKIDAIDTILLLRVYMYDCHGHTGVWKVYLPRDLDPSEVTAQLTDEGHLILEENLRSS